MRKRTWYRLYCGMFLLVLVGVAFFGAYSGINLEKQPQKVETGLYDFFNEWQTLITGLIALFVGKWTVSNLKQQMQLQRSQQERSEQRKELVAKAQLPDALADITRYASTCLSRLVENGNHFEAPEHPADAIGVIKTALEFVAQEPAEVLFELIRYYQVHNSRLADPVGTYWRFERAANAVQLYWMAERLFIYARGEEPTVKEAKPNLQEMRRCLRACAGLSYYLQNMSRYAGVEAIIQRDFGPR